MDFSTEGWGPKHDISFHTSDMEIAISTMDTPELNSEEAQGTAMLVPDEPDELVASGPTRRIDEATREVFRKVGEEYDELCDRLFNDDPAFSYCSAKDIEPR